MFPAEVLTPKLKEKRPLKFKTATGETANSSGDLKLERWSEQGSKMSCSGKLAPVHKSLTAAEQVSEKGNDIWIAGDSAYLAKSSKIAKNRRNALDRAMHKRERKYIVRVYKERGVYNMYVQVRHDASTSKRGKSLCAAAEISPISGDQRRDMNP